MGPRQRGEAVMKAGGSNEARLFPSSEEARKKFARVAQLLDCDPQLMPPLGIELFDFCSLFQNFTVALGKNLSCELDSLTLALSHKQLVVAVRPLAISHP